MYYNGHTSVMTLYYMLAHLPRTLKEMKMYLQGVAALNMHRLRSCLGKYVEWSLHWSSTSQ